MMPTPFESWVMARLISDEPVNGELAGMSEPWRTLAVKMAARQSTDRGEILEIFLAGRPERNDVIEAVANQDGKGPPPPVDSAPTGSDWPALRLDALPAVDLFPVDVLPDPAARLVIEGASAIGCPKDFLGVPMLAVAAGTIGRSASLFLKGGYFTSTTTFAICVGPPSDGKTPALKAVARPVRAIGDDLAVEHAKAIEQWKANAAALTAGKGGSKPKPPPPPKPRRIDIDDATMEVVPIILADNERGVIMIRDEISALMLGLNQYKGGKGSDRSNLLKIWSGDRITKDRVKDENNEPIRCAHPSMSIVGGLTPDMLGELTDPRGRADGFIDRFLVSYPDSLPVADWSTSGIPDDVANGWHALIARLWLRSLDFKDGRTVPHVAYFTPEGKTRWEELYNAHSAEMNAGDFPPFLRGPWGKLREYAGRLTLILTLMHHAADSLADALAVPKVDARRVDDAWKLIAYFKSHARRVQAAIARGPASGKTRAVKAIVEWIRAEHRALVTESDISQARRWIGKDDLADALTYLADRHAIRSRPAPQIGPKGGRPPSPAYDVNPALLITGNP
jgi:Protein of unknown function (DUF3987)